MRAGWVGVLGAVACLSGCGGGGDGDGVRVLGTWTVPGGNGQTLILTSLEFDCGASSNLAGPFFKLFDVVVAPADVPAVFVVDSPGDDPDFTEVVQLLSNGTDGAVEFSDGLSMFSRLESQAFGRPPGDPDFAASTITRIELHVDSLTLASPGSDPNADGNWTDVTYTARVVVVGRPN